jgi:hypothetical protein
VISPSIRAIAGREIARESGKLQRYGTQFDWFAADFKLPEPRRLAEIDTERGCVGLMPLADYVCTIRTAREKLK